MGARRRGSVRFDPYFKLQWWEERSLAWRDVQRAFATAEEAAEARTDEHPRWRVMEITEDGRAPVREL